MIDVPHILLNFLSAEQLQITSGIYLKSKIEIKIKIFRSRCIVEMISVSSCQIAIST